MQNNVNSRYKHMLVNLAWGFYFALWAGVHLKLCRSFEGGQLLVELLLIFQNLMLMFFFIVRHPPRATSWRPFDLLWATLGGFGMTLCWSTVRNDPPIIGITLQIAGALMTLYASLSLGRSWGVIPSNRSIQTKGMYRFIRHPIYASWQIFFIGYLICQPSYYNMTIGAVCFLSQIMRIFAEERLLTQDPDYVKYSDRVRWRMIPYIF